MTTSQVTKSTQEQAVASWIDNINQVRLDELIGSLKSQDSNFLGALSQLQELKNFVAHPEHIRGNM